MSWPREAFVRAVWESETLRPLERLVALVYADHAGSDDHAWVTYPRMQQRTGLSRDAIARALDGLRAADWLVMKEASRQQKSTRYWLRVPAQQSDIQTADETQPPASQTAGYPHASASRTAESTSPLADGPQASSSPLPPDTSPLPPDTSSPRGRGDHSSDHSPEGESDDVGAAEHAEAVAWLVAKHGPDFTEDHAILATDSIAAWARRKGDPVRDMVAFVAVRPLEDLQRWAGVKSQRPTTTPRGGPRRRVCPEGALIASDGACCPTCETTARRVS